MESKHGLQLIMDGRPCELCSKPCSGYHLPNHLLELAAFALPINLGLADSQAGGSSVAEVAESSMMSTDMGSLILFDNDMDAEKEGLALVQDATIPATEGFEGAGWDFVGGKFERGSEAGLQQDLNEDDPILDSIRSRQEGAAESKHENLAKDHANLTADISDELNTYILPLLKAQLSILTRLWQSAPKQ
jgi:hypothetical protein